MLRLMRKVISWHLILVILISAQFSIVSQAIASGADVIAISRIAGHANPSITLNVYGHILKDSMGSIQRALDETYADMRSTEGTQKQDLPSAS